MDGHELNGHYTKAILPQQDGFCINSQSYDNYLTITNGLDFNK
jgi:hypothetical protein